MEEDFALQKSVEIRRLITELRGLVEENQALRDSHRKARDTLMEKMFIHGRLALLSRKTAKYSKKIRSVFGLEGEEALARLEEAIERMSHALSRKKLVLEFRSQIAKKGGG